MHEDFLRVLDVVATSRFWKPLCAMNLHTKLRYNEMLELKWSDVDLENRTISFDKGNQKCMIVDALFLSLEEYRNYREREQKRNRGLYSYTTQSDYVFGNDKGEKRSYSGLSHNFRKFLKGKKLENTDFTLKKLRHVFGRYNKKIISNPTPISNEIHSTLNDFEM